MNKSIFTLLVCGGLIFSTFAPGQSVQAQGFSFPAQMNKSFDPLHIEPAGISRLEVTVYNPNSFDLTNASWTDNLVSIQPGISIASPPNVSNTCGGTVTATPGRHPAVTERRHGSQANWRDTRILYRFRGCDLHNAREPDQHHSGEHT